MAYLAVDAIKERLRELVEDGAGTVRAISSRFGGDLPEGLSEQEELRRGIATLAPAEVRIVGMRKHPQQIARLGNVQIHLLDIEVRVVRTFDVSHHVDDDLRDDIEALAYVDGDALRQVFEIPANLHTTEGSTATGLVGGEYEGSVGAIRGPASGEANAIVTKHRFTFTATSSPA